MAKQKSAPPKCAVCSAQPSKYRCSACPVRYCSVVCYKVHKAETCQAVPTPFRRPDTPPHAAPVPPSSPTLPGPSLHKRRRTSSSSPSSASSSRAPPPLKPLSAIAWPPEPDASIFMDPLKRDDPKPLRREELMRIATSPQLRHLLSSSTLPALLRALDALHSPAVRSRSLARLIGLDPQSLSKSQSGSLVDQRDSPPPLQDLLRALAGEEPARAAAEDDDGWWLGPPPSRSATTEGKTEQGVWVTGKEKELMRLFAGIVCRAIEGEEGDGGYGSGNLSWEV